MQLGFRSTIEDFTEFNPNLLRYKQVAIMERRFGRKSYASASRLFEFSEELYKCVFYSVLDLFDTFLAEELATKQVKVIIPGTLPYELALITSPQQDYSIEWSFEQKKLVCSPRPVPYQESSNVTTL